MELRNRTSRRSHSDSDEDEIRPKSKISSRNTRRKSSSSPLGFSMLLKVALALAVISISLSYFTLGTPFWGYKIPNIRSKMVQWGLKDEITLTEDQLAQYDGSDPDKPIYIAIKGNVFDVSPGRKYYGKGGSYSFFSGKDSARAYVTGCFKEHLTHDIRGLTETQLKGIDNWIKFYKDHDMYSYVGKVLHPDIDPDTPIPENCNNAKPPYEGKKAPQSIA